MRAAGLLLHPTSLPGPFGIGDLGPSAVRFLDWAAEAGQTIWQFLPLGPTDASHSPYATLSSWAGSPLLLSPQRLVEAGWLRSDEVAPEPPSTLVRFEQAAPRKRELLRLAWRRFDREAGREERARLEAFVEAESRRRWLDDWALFAALIEREGHAGRFVRSGLPARAALESGLADALAEQRWPPAPVLRAVGIAPP